MVGPPAPKLVVGQDAYMVLDRYPSWFCGQKGKVVRVTSSAINTDNYNFDYIGEAVLDGQSCYILALKPKRKETDLISGEVWMATFTWNKGATLPTTSLEASMESPADVISFPATGRKAPSRRDASFHRPVETCHLPLWKRSPKLRS
jgi:hypothetical protein